MNEHVKTAIGHSACPHDCPSTCALEVELIGANRIERDSMGEMEVPADALYGASTQRAVLNFPISGRPGANSLHPFCS